MLALRGMLKLAKINAITDVGHMGMNKSVPIAFQKKAYLDLFWTRTNFEFSFTDLSCVLHILKLSFSNSELKNGLQRFHSDIIT